MNFQKKSNYEKALEKYQSALQIHRWLPYHAEFPELKKEADEKYQKVLLYTRGKEKKIIENLVKDMQGHYEKGEFNKAFEKADAALQLQREFPSSGKYPDLQKRAEKIYHTTIAQNKIKVIFSDRDTREGKEVLKPGPEMLPSITEEKPAGKGDKELKAEVIANFNLLKQKHSGVVSGEAEGGRAAGVKPLLIGFEYSEGNIHRFKGRPRGGEIKPLEMTTLSYTLIQRISLFLMLLSCMALFAGQTWKISGILAICALGGILISIYMENIFSYFAAHAAAGFVAALCISVIINIVKTFNNKIRVK